MGRILAWMMVVLSVAAAVGYGTSGDWRRMTYWIAAAVLQVAVTI